MNTAYTVGLAPSTTLCAGRTKRQRVRQAIGTVCGRALACRLKYYTLRNNTARSP